MNSQSPLRTHWPFYLYALCLSMSNSLIGMYLAWFLKSRGIAEEHIGQIMFTYYLMQPVVVCLFGFLTDRMSSRPLLVLGSLLSIGYCATMPQVTEARTMALLIMAAGTGITLSTISSGVLFLKSLPGERRGRALSLFVGMSLFGYSTGTSLSALLIDRLPLPPSTIFYAALPLHVICLVVSFRLPAAKLERFPVIEYLADLRRVPVFALGLLTFAVGIHFGTEHTVLVRFMAESLRLSGLQIFFYFILVGIGMPIASRWAGHLTDTHGRVMDFMIPAMILSGLSLALVAATAGMTSFVAVRMVHIAADGVLIFGIQMLVSLVFVSSRMGGNYGFNRTISSVGASLGALLAGYTVARHGLGGPLVVAGLLQVGAALLLLPLRRRMPTAQLATPVVPPVPTPEPMAD